MGSIIVPIFYGEDPELWIEWVDAFVSAHSFSDFETIQFAYGFIEGEALEWYCDEIARSVFNSWEDLKKRLFQRFRKSVEFAGELNLQDRLKQLSRDMDRWDEDEAKKQQEEEMMVAGDSNQILSSVEGFVKSFESALPETVSGEKDDLILYSNQLIPEVKNEMLILDCPVLVQEKDDPETETLVFEEDNSLETEMDVGACQVTMIFELAVVEKKSLISSRKVRFRKKHMKKELSFELLLSSVRNTYNRKEIVEGAMCRPGTVTRYFVTWREVDKGQNVELIWKVFIWFETWDYIKANGKEQEENIRIQVPQFVHFVAELSVPSVIQWKEICIRVYMNQELQKQIGRGYGLNWMGIRTVLKPYEAVCWKFQERESLTLASGHAATKEMFHFLKPPEFSIFKEGKGQELEQDNKTQDSPGSTLFIPVSLVTDNDSSWNSRWDVTSQALMAFGSNEREASSWTQVAAIDFDWDPGGTSLEKVHEALLIMAGCLLAMEQRIFLKLSVTRMKRSLEADLVEEFEMGRSSVMGMKLPLVREKTLQLTVDHFHPHVALVYVELLFHFTRPPELRAMGSIIVPIFYGEDPELWIEWVDAFVSAHSFSDFETIQFAYGFIEGEALEWYCDEIARSVFNSWEDLKKRLFQRFRKSVEFAGELNLQDRLKQLSRDMDRWDEDEAKKQQEEEMMVAGDSNQILSSVEGFVKSFESALPETVSGEKDDLILYSNQLIPEVKNEMLILDCPVLVQEKDDPETETLVFEEDNSLETEMDVGACQVTMIFELAVVEKKSLISSRKVRFRKKHMKKELSFELLLSSVRNTYNRKEIVEGAMCRPGTVTRYFVTWREVDKGQNVELIWKVFIWFETWDYIKANGKEQEENIRIQVPQFVHFVAELSVPSVIQWKEICIRVYMNQELQKQIGRGYGLNWMGIRTVLKPYEAVCWKFQERESLTLASGHAATKEMFHFLKPPEFSIFKEGKGQELEQDNKTQDSPGSTLFIPVSLVTDNDSSWNSRWDVTSQALMAFGSNEREASSWTQVAAIDFDWDPGGTSLEKVHEALLIMAGCLLAMEQRIFLKLSVTRMKRSLEADLVEEFEMGRSSVMGMKLPLVREKTLQLTVDHFHPHVALVYVELLFHFTRPPELRAMGSIIVPIFYGEDPELWIEWVDAFVSAHSFSDFETIQFAYGFIEGEALEWYCDEIARSVFNSWEDLKKRLFQRFRKSVEFAGELNLQDRLKQLSRDMDRWDEDEAKKQQEEEMMVAGDSNQILSSVEGFVKSFESALPETVSGEKDDLILYSNQLIPEVKNEMLILDCPVLVQEKDDPETETLVFEEDNSLETEMDVGACQKMAETKWFWEAVLGAEASFY
ncbi:hypothetical protein HID58_031011 [Brassica napus]|uniref:Uncharacterized protein n=4 Tax=Brassica TaxID=3705 RepID=A0ABQ8CHL4_BRANA|nr:hypothetical protein HID58_031011 [Brassica napus]